MNINIFIPGPVPFDNARALNDWVRKEAKKIHDAQPINWMLCANCDHFHDLGDLMGLEESPIAN